MQYTNLNTWINVNTCAIWTVNDNIYIYTGKYIYTHTIGFRFNSFEIKILFFSFWNILMTEIKKYIKKKTHNSSWAYAPITLKKVQKV